jgi:hypothetical protein
VNNNVTDFSFSINAVLPPTTSQQEVFDTCVKDIVDGALDGVSGCVLAYGQTGAGKTHTIMGPPKDPGIIPRAIAKIFEEIENYPNTMFVAATYLNMPKRGGYFECKDPLEYHKCGYNHEDQSWMWKEIPTISGDILIFPGWLQHRTQPNLSNEKRWVLTTNFYQEPEADNTLLKK